jgi:amino acid transporter
MFEKFRRRNREGVDGDAYERGTDFQSGDGYTGDDSGETASHTAVMDRPRTAGTHTAPAGATSTAAGARTVEEARAMQRDRFGGADGTAIFFGWLSAFGLAALLLAVVAAAGTRLGFTNNVSTQDATGTIGIVGAAVLVVILLISYLGGGYAAGRIARFDGARQGLRVWLLGLLVTIAAAVAGWIGGSQYNIYEQLNLPRIPVDEGDIATLAIVTLAVVLLGTLVAAIAGGKAGERYHARVDAMAWDRDRV